MPSADLVIAGVIAFVVVVLFAAIAGFVIWRRVRRHSPWRDTYRSLGG